MQTDYPVLVAQSCLAVCDLVNCSPPGSPVHGILQARILEWVAISSSRGSSRSRDRTCISCIVRCDTVNVKKWFLLENGIGRVGRGELKEANYVDISLKQF